MIEEIVKIEDPAQAIIELDTRLNELCDYGADLSKLSSGEKTVLFVENIEREVNNGGFHQFFWNTSGNFAYETLSALRSIGASKMASIVERAYTQWPNGSIPRDQTERQELLELIEDRAPPEWNKCDNEFWQYPDNVAQLLMDYVKANLQEFR